MDFHGMKRKDLQALCKKHSLAANGTNLEMADRLASHLKKPDLQPKPLKGLQKNDEVRGVDSSKVVGLEKNDEVKVEVVGLENNEEVKDVGSSKVVTRRAKKVRFCLEEVEQAKIVDLTKNDDENVVTKKSSMKPGFEKSTHKIEVIPVRMTRSRRGAEVASLPSSPVAKKKPRRGVDVEIADKEKDTSETESRKEEEPIASSVPVAKNTLKGKGAKKESEDLEKEISSVENLDDGGKSRNKVGEEVGARVTRSLRNTQVLTDGVEENLKKKDISPRKTRKQREEGKGEDEAEDVAAVKPTARQTRSRKSGSAQEESSTVSKPAEKPVERASRRSNRNVITTENTAVLDEQNETLSEGKIDAPVESDSLTEPEKATRRSRKRGNAQEESTTVLKPAEKPVERTSRRSKGNASATESTVALDGKHETLSEGRIDVPENKVHEESESIPRPEKATRRSKRNASANDDSAQLDGKSGTTAVSKPEEKQEGRASRRSTRNASSIESTVVLDRKNETLSKENVDVPENKVHEESESIPKSGKATRRSRRNASANDDSVNVDGQSGTAGVIVKGNTTKSTSEVDQAAPRRSTRSAHSTKESVPADISDNQKAGQSVSITEEPAKDARTRTSKRKSVAPTSVVAEQPSRRSRHNSTNDESMTLTDLEEKSVNVKGGKKTRSQKQQAKGTDTTESSVDKANTVAEELPRKPTRGASRRQTTAVDSVLPAAEHETYVLEGATADHKKEKVAIGGSDKAKTRAKQFSGQGKRGQSMAKQPEQKSDIQVEVEVSTKELAEVSYKSHLNSIEEVPEDSNGDPVMGANAVDNDLKQSEQQVSDHVVLTEKESYIENESMTLRESESDDHSHTVIESDSRDEQDALVPEELPTPSVAGVTTKGAAETARENTSDKLEKTVDDCRLPEAADQNKFNELVELPPTKTSSETQLEIGAEATHEETSSFLQVDEECGQADSSPIVADSHSTPGSGRDAKYGQAYSSVVVDNLGPIEPSLCHNHEETSVFQPADEECGQADFSPIAARIMDSQYIPGSGKDAKHGQADSSVAADNLVPIEPSLYTNDGSVCNELRETADEKAVLNQSASGDADVVVEQEKQSPLELGLENLGESSIVKRQDNLAEKSVNVNEGESGYCDSEKQHVELFNAVNEHKQNLANLLEDFVDEHASEELLVMLQKSQESHKKKATADRYFACGTRPIRSSISPFCRSDIELDDNVITRQQDEVSETSIKKAILGTTYDEETINVSEGENASAVLLFGNVSDNVCVDEDSPMKGSGGTSQESNPTVAAEPSMVFKNAGDEHGEVGAKGYLQTSAAEDVKSQDMTEYPSGDESLEEDSIIGVRGLDETSLRIDEYGQAESSLEPRHHAAKESFQLNCERAADVDEIATAVQESGEFANDAASFKEGDKVEPLQQDPEVLFKRKEILELQDIHGSQAGVISEENIQVEATPGRKEEGDLFEDEMTSTSLLFKAGTSSHAEEEETFDSDHVSDNNQTDSPSHVEDEEKLDADHSCDVNELEIKLQQASAVKVKQGSGDALSSNSNEADEAPVESVELKGGSKVADEENIRTPLSDACRSGNTEDVDGGATIGKDIDLENDADVVEQEEYPENRTVGISHSSPGTENVVASGKVDDDKAICTPLFGAYRRSNIDDADRGATSGKAIDFKKDADIVEEEEDPEDETIGPSEEVQELTDLKNGAVSELHPHSSVSDEHISIKELFEEAAAEDESDSIGDVDVAVDEATSPSASLLHDDKDIGISLAYPSMSTHVEDEEVMEPTEDDCLLEKNSYSGEEKDDTESSPHVSAELVELNTKEVQQMPDLDDEYFEEQLEVKVGSSGCKFGSSMVGNATAADEGIEMNNHSTKEEDLESLQHVFEQPAKPKGDDERVDYAEAAETSLISASVPSKMEDEKLMETAMDAHVFEKTNHSTEEDDAESLQHDSELKSGNATAAYVEPAKTSPISASVPSNADDEDIMRTTEDDLLFENNDLFVADNEDASKELVDQKSGEAQQMDASYMVDCGKQLFEGIGCSEYIETATDTPISQGTKLEKEASLEPNIFLENTSEFGLKGESTKCQQEVSDCEGNELRSGGKLASTASKHDNFEEGEEGASDCQSGKKLAEDEDAVPSPLSAVCMKQNLSSGEFEYEEASSTVGRSAQTSVVKKNRFDCLRSGLAYSVIDEELLQSDIKLAEEEDAMPSSLSDVSNKRNLIDAEFEYKEAPSTVCQGAQSLVVKKDNFECLTSAPEGEENFQSGIKLAEEENATLSPLPAVCTKQNLSYGESEYEGTPSTVGRSAQTSVVKKNKFQCLTSSIAYKLIDEEKEKLNATSSHQNVLKTDGEEETRVNVEDNAERQLLFDNSLLDDCEEDVEGTTTQQVLQYETDLEHLMKGLPEGDEESKDKAVEFSAWEIDMFCGQECGAFSQIRTSEETEDVTRNSAKGNKLEHKDDIGNSSVGVLSLDQAEDNGEEVENMESSLREAFAAEETEVEENVAESTPKKPDVEDNKEEENIQSSLRAMFATPINCEEDEDKKIEKEEMEEEATPMRRLGGRRDSMDEINSHLKKFHITSAVKGTRFRACTATPMRTPMRSSLGFQQSDMKENYPMMKIEQSANRHVERSGMKRNSQIDQLEKSVSKRRALGDLQNNPTNTSNSADK